MLQHLICVSTVCLCPTKKMLGLYGLKAFNSYNFLKMDAVSIYVVLSRQCITKMLIRLHEDAQADLPLSYWPTTKRHGT